MSGFAAAARLVVAPVPPNGRPPASAAHERQVMRQDKKAERDHPESENRKEAQDAAAHQCGSGRDPTAPGAGHRDLKATEDQSAACLVEASASLRQSVNLPMLQASQPCFHAF